MSAGRLQAAYAAALRARSIAEADCPHWDHEGGPDAGMPCCYELADAEARVRRLGRRLRALDAARAGDADSYHVLTRG